METVEAIEIGVERTEHRAMLDGERGQVDLEVARSRVDQRYGILPYHAATISKAATTTTWLSCEILRFQLPSVNLRLSPSSSIRSASVSALFQQKHCLAPIGKHL